MSSVKDILGVRSLVHWEAVLPRFAQVVLSVLEDGTTDIPVVTAECERKMTMIKWWEAVSAHFYSCMNFQIYKTRNLHAWNATLTSIERWYIGNVQKNDILIYLCRFKHNMAQLLIYFNFFLYTYKLHIYIFILILLSHVTARRNTRRDAIKQR